MFFVDFSSEIAIIASEVMKMPLNEHFIPGQWIDTIDVNDFVILNKKPFLKEPLFLKSTSTESTLQRFSAIQEVLQQSQVEIDLSFPLLENEEIPWIHQNFSDNPLKRKIGYSENVRDMKEFYGVPSGKLRKENRKTPYELFVEVATSEINKMIKMNLFVHAPTLYSPPFVHPDVRMIPLYGTKELIKEKRWALKTLEKHLQTHEWMQRRMSLHREIEAIKNFEKFAQKQGFDVSNPAQSAKQASLFLYLAIAGCMMENPSVPFSLNQVIPFLDIYIEHDLQNGVLSNEEMAQEIIDEFYLNLAFIRFSYSPGFRKQHKEEPIFFGETFGGEHLTKSTYRFLHSLRKFRLFPFSIRILWNEDTPSYFETFVQELIDEEIPISFYAMKHYRRNLTSGFVANGLYGVPGEDVLFHAGACDMEKLFYLSLNGGKDVKENINLTPITQPFRKDELFYDEVVDKWKDYIAYVLNAYVEMMNITLYLNDIHNAHPFRSSLLNYLFYYHVQFGFFNMEKTAHLLSGIYEESYTVVRDKKGWVTEILPGEEVTVNEAVLAFLVEYIQQEIVKIPIYKNGRAHVKAYYQGVEDEITEEALSKLAIIPAEMTAVVFHANVHVTDNLSVTHFLKQHFERGFRELHLFKNQEEKVIDGILYKEKE